jgi:hypothetical protein
MYVPDTLIVRTDPTATANNIATHDLLFRLGIVSDLLVGGASTLSDLRAISYVRLTDGELREIDLPALYERYQSLAAW